MQEDDLRGSAKTFFVRYDFPKDFDYIYFLELSCIFLDNYRVYI